MTFKTVETQEVEYGKITLIDGYSKAKTLKGALLDLAMEIEKVSKIEAYGLRDLISSPNEYGNEWLIPNNFDNGYCLEVEEVGFASRINPKTDEMEYALGNFYIFTRFLQ